MNDNHPRPVTSKARGICKYYTTPRGCFGGNNCKFLHISESDLQADRSQPVLTPYDKAKQCRYYANGYCKHGDKCWFLHDDNTVKRPEKDAGGGGAEEMNCSICFEKPATYGLLDACSHIFCLHCIRQWRDRSNKVLDESGNTKKCPMCRGNSRYIIPSSRFWSDDQEEKARVIQRYKESMGRVPCKHFVESKLKNPSKPLCPFGKECFYQHLNDDGTPHVLKDNADAAMRAWRNAMSRSRGPLLGDPFRITLDIRPTGDAVNAANLAGGIAMDMFSRMVAEVMSGVAGRRGRGRERRRGARTRGASVDQTTLDRARERMMEGAMTAIQVALDRHDPRNVDETRPVFTPGTPAPAEWDLDGGWLDDGWEWDTHENTATGYADVIERLGILVGDRDNDTPPPLEPTTQHPIAPELDTVADNDDIPTLRSVSGSRQSSDVDPDELPELRSVTNSSESEYEDDDEDEGEAEQHGYDAETGAERVENAIWALDLVFNPQNSSGASEQASEMWGPLSGLWSHAPPSTTPASDTSSRFSTVVGREGRPRSRMDTDDDEPDEADDEAGEQEEVAEPEGAGPPQGQETSETETEPPPFVTDGRGRVVWSNKAPETGVTGPPAGPAAAAGDTSGVPRTFIGRVLDVFF